MKKLFVLTQESKMQMSELLKQGFSGIVLHYRDGSQKVLATGSSSGQALHTNGILKASDKPVFVHSFISILASVYIENGNYWEYWYTWNEYLHHLRMDSYIDSYVDTYVAPTPVIDRAWILAQLENAVKESTQIKTALARWTKFEELTTQLRKQVPSDLMSFWEQELEKSSKLAF